MEQGMGRLVWHQLRGKAIRQLMIVTTYHVYVPGHKKLRSRGVVSLEAVGRNPEK